MNYPSFIILGIYSFIFISNTTAQDLSHYESYLDSATVYLSNKSPEKALELLNPLTQTKHPEIAVKALRLSGSAYISNRNFDKARDALGRSLTLSTEIFDQNEQAHSLYLLGRAEALTGNFEQAKIHALEGIYISRILNEKELEYHLNNLLSWSYFATGENFNKVLEHEARQIQVVNTFRDLRRKALVYNNLGYDLTVAGTVPIDSTISLMKFANDTYAELEGHEGRWYTLMNLTWQHRLKYDLETSRMYGEKSLTQALAEEDRHAIVEAAFQLGETLIEMGRIEEARPYYETGLKWRGEEEDRDRYVFDVYYARFLWETGEQDRAISMLESAVDWLIQSEVFYEMHGRALLATFYLEKGAYEKADSQLQMIEKPRHNYISLESRCIAAMTKARFLTENGKHTIAKALMRSWLDHTSKMDMKQLSRKVKKTFPEL